MRTAPLCAFCDEVLPEKPSKELLKNGSALQAKSWSEPYDDNEGHRAYHMKDSELFDLHCREHRRESYLERMGSRYPSPINFGDLTHHIAPLLSHLTALLREPHANEFYQQAVKQYRPNAPSHLLQSLMEDATAG